MKKSLICAVLSMLMVCVFVFSLPLTSFAVDSFELAINEPAIGDNQGYALFLLENRSTGSHSLTCMHWTCLPLVYYDGDGDNVNNNAEMLLDIVSSSKVTFTVRSYSSNTSQISVGFGLSLGNVSSKQTNYWWGTFDGNGDTAYTYNFGASYKLIGYQVYGNAVVSSKDLGSNNNVPFTVSWGDDVSFLSDLNELISICYQLAADNDTMIAQLDKILTNTNDIEKLCTDLVSWAQKNNLQLIDINSKLDEILEILNSSGESTFEEPSTDNINDYNKNEDELLSGADDTSDLEQDIEDFEIDADSSSLIWGIIQGYLNQNELVFGLVVGVLCLGIIALILNR